MLGEQQVQALLGKLKNATTQEERVQVILNIEELGKSAQSEVIRELVAANPWYVYRNLLNILTKIGDENTLIPIAEKLSHGDIRVRTAAITAIAHIGREQAMPYLLQALRDPSPAMRSVAASHAALCPQPKILNALLELFHVSFPWQGQPDNVRLVACISLGEFNDQRARRALMRVVVPSALSIRNESEIMRCAAINALEKQIAHDNDEVLNTLRHASNDSNPQIRNTAMQVLARHQRNETAVAESAQQTDIPEKPAIFNKIEVLNKTDIFHNTEVAQQTEIINEPEIAHQMQHEHQTDNERV
jgi:HEAT repeat protein